MAVIVTLRVGIVEVTMFVTTSQANVLMAVSLIGRETGVMVGIYCFSFFI